MMLSATGCGEGGLDLDTSKAAEFGFQKSIQTTLVEEGRAAYRTYCIGCHGEKGDGNGPAARFLSPRPRNFTTGRFKFSSTRAGLLPTDEDLRRTITRGLKGSAMPGWDMLPARTVTALIAYLKTFSPKWKEQSPASPIPKVDDPYRALEDKSEAIARGEKVYHGFAACWSCHPAYVSEEKINEYLVEFESEPREGFRPNLRQSQGKVNADGELIYPPDFTRDFVRSGAAVDDLYRSIAAGITGTAMPTWVDSMEIPSTKHPDIPLVQPSDLWALAYYVQSLILQRPARLVPGEFAVRDRRQKILGPDEPWVPLPQVEETPAGETFEEGEFEEDE